MLLLNLILLQQWTPSGDAFIIRSDLKRLESETLPKYFRHNRFQSLVRQLNFYSFRKINRERNVWIYKHQLFHRDHPENLHLVRRRTCPGLDGRKQRFSRVSARQLSGGTTGSASDVEDSSLEGTNTTVNEVSVSSDGSDKRDLDTSLRDQQPEQKRSRKVYTYHVPDKNIFVDTSMLMDPSPSADDREEISSRAETNDRFEAAEQSLIVSEVSKKLEQFAKRASYGGTASRTKRGGSGVVTPPFGASLPFSSTITYDDEYLAPPDEAKNDAWVIKDSEGIAEAGTVVTPLKEKNIVGAENLETAKTIVARVLESLSAEQRVELVATSSILDFCVATAPVCDKDFSGKILHLLSQCDKLAIDFNTYRAALRPDTLPARGALKQTWERETSRVEAIRDFKMFAVNVFSKFLDASDSIPDMPDLAMDSQDRVVLERTASAWVNSL